MYASHTTAKPTYEPDHYSLQSTTCGEDIIVVPDNFKRPVSIGVYGHPSHELSKYTLLVYEVISMDDQTTYDQKVENIYKDSDNKKKSPTFIVTFMRSIGNVLFEIFF